MPSLAKELAELISTTGQITVQNEDIVSVANTKIDGLITSNQIANVAADKIIGTLGGNYVQQVYTSPATWTKPEGLKAVKVTVVGAGGGSAAYDTPGQSATPGGTTSFGAFLSATGGAGAASNGPTVDGSGGAGSGGQLNVTGSPGSFSGQSGFAFGRGVSAGNNGEIYGGGASSSWPNGGLARAGGGGASIEYLTAPGLPGPVAVTVGSGGTGSGQGGTARTGAVGLVIVEEFY